MYQQNLLQSVRDSAINSELIEGKYIYLLFCWFAGLIKMLNNAVPGTSRARESRLYSRQLVGSSLAPFHTTLVATS